MKQVFRVFIFIITLGCHVGIFAQINLNSAEAKKVDDVLNDKYNASRTSSPKSTTRNGNSYSNNTTYSNSTTPKTKSTSTGRRPNNAEANRQAKEIANRANNSPFAKNGSNQSASPKTIQDPENDKFKNQVVNGLKGSQFKDGHIYDGQGNQLSVDGQATKDLETVYNRTKKMLNAAKSSDLKSAYDLFQNLYNDVPRWEGFGQLPQNYASWTQEQKVAYSYLAEIKYYEFVNSEANKILQQANAMLREKTGNQKAKVAIDRKELFKRLEYKNPTGRNTTASTTSNNSSRNNQDAVSYVTQAITTGVAESNKTQTVEEKRNVTAEVSKTCQASSENVQKRKNQLALLKDKIKASGCTDCP